MILMIPILHYQEYGGIPTQSLRMDTLIMMTWKQLNLMTPTLQNLDLNHLILHLIINQLQIT